MSMASTMFDPKEREAFLKMFNDTSTFSAGTDLMSTSNFKIKPWKCAVGTYGFVYPLAIHVNFNLETGEPSKYNIPLPGSVHQAAGFLKELAANNPAIAALLKERLPKFSQLNFETPGITEAEAKVFRPLTKILLYAREVMSIKDPGSKFPYGTKFAVDLPRDKDGNIIEDMNTPLPYKLLKLENACIAAINAEDIEKNEKLTVGKRPASELQGISSNRWKNKAMSDPYVMGATRVEVFALQSVGKYKEEEVKLYTPDEKGIAKFERYVAVTKDTAASLEEILDTPYDRYTDFLLYRDKVEPKSADSGNLVNHNRSPMPSEEAIELSFPGFIEAYRKYRNKIERWDEAIIKRSVYAFFHMSDDVVISKFKNSMPTLHAALSIGNIYDEYSEVIGLVDSTVGEELITAAMSGEFKPAIDYSVELKKAPVTTEEDIGMGGDSLNDAEEDLSALSEEELVMLNSDLA